MSITCSHIAGLHFTRTTESVTNTFNATTGLVRSTAKNELNLSYLLAGIGILVLIVICMTHLYQTVRIRKKWIPSNIHIRNEKKRIRQANGTHLQRNRR